MRGGSLHAVTIARCGAVSGARREERSTSATRRRASTSSTFAGVAYPWRTSQQQTMLPVRPMPP